MRTLELVRKIVFPYLFRCLDYGRFFTCFVRQSWPVETGFRAVLNVTQSLHLIQTNFKFILNSCFKLNSDVFNAERCRPGSDLGWHFSADLNFFFLRAAMYMYIQITHYCCQINNIITVYKGKIVLCEYALTKMYYILYIYYMIMVRLYFQWNYTICMVNLRWWILW